MTRHAGPGAQEVGELGRAVRGQGGSPPEATVGGRRRRDRGSDPRSGAAAGLREAAFGATPQDVPLGSADPELRWLTAVALGGQGHYAAAATVLACLAADPRVPVRVAAHAAVTRAAHLRQLGGHAAARAYDAHGLRLATAALRAGAPGPRGVTPIELGTAARGRTRDDGLDAAAARLDALVGLAADAVGLGDPTTCRRLLDVVGEGLDGHPSWRPAVRAGWVRAELALIQGHAGDAVVPAEAALAAATRAGSVRHVLKSRIVLVVARGAAGVLDPAEGAADLDAIGAECARYGLLPLRWPTALAAADLQERINEQVASPAESALGGQMNGATRRRHAARAALNVIESRSDPLGKRQMGESVWIPRPVTLM
jgi:hypothetical protein